MTVQGVVETIGGVVRVDVTPSAYGGRVQDLTVAVRDAVLARRPVDARERASITEFVRRFDLLEHPFSEQADKVHVTASAILVTDDHRRVLLHLHKRLQKWLQPGGHIDEGELPWQAALREAGEETGLPVHMPAGEHALLHVDTHSGGRKHIHLDLRYLVESPNVPPTPPDDESQDVHWFHWHQAIAAADPGLEGVLRALQPGTPTIRQARHTDAKDAASVYLRSREFGLPEVPLVHPPSEVRQWMADGVVGHTDMWVADNDGVVTGMMVLSHQRDGSWIEHLYLDPSWVGRGLGDRFLELARQRCPEGMQLWAFQSNGPARRFYERHGFVVEELTDGRGNEERSPDVRLRWTPTP